MAKISGTKKWKKRTLTALSVALAATLSMGVFSACATTATDSGDNDNESVVSPTDEQLLRNGNFEFYSDNNLSDTVKKYNIINSPNNWTFTSGSPSSNAASGIINTAEWDYFTKTGGYDFKTFVKNEPEKEDEEPEEVTTFESISEAYKHWEDENVSAYDRIKFLDIFSDEIKKLDSDSDEAKLFAKYKYKVDYDDIKNLDEDLPDGVALHEGVNEDETSILMIHNDRNLENEDLRGTAQYYTSSTTITLSAGTSAKVSVWVRTDKLYHYEDTELTARGGAYIGVTNTVGGSTLDQMQIYNINTQGEWKEYTVYVRASTFATSTIRIVLGLGQGSSDDRYYSVDGYAFFDDVSCEIISNDDYKENVIDQNNVYTCTVDSSKEEKQLPVDEPLYKDYSVFALDLYAGFPIKGLLDEKTEFDLTTEKSGRKEYTSEDIHSSLGDDTAQNFRQVTTIGELSASDREYVKNVYENDFDGKFPFDENEPIVMLLSGNGAAYTATVTSTQFTMPANTRMLISFFVKTNNVPSGLTGAGAAIVDGDSRTTINAFNSTTISAVNIDAKSDDESKKDIYKGWVQCFFFLENVTESEKTFTLELTLGPTKIIGTNQFSYGDGYAAFTNFEAKQLTKTEYGYASTGDRAVKVSLTGGVEENARFDSVSAVDEKLLKERPALPANYVGVLGGSNFIVNGGEENIKPEGITAGLLNSKYADNYYTSTEDWRRVLNVSGAQNSTDWWQGMFGNARQPLVIVNNGENTSYGYFAADSTMVSASSYQRISMRVKASVGTTAYIYLIDMSVKNASQALSPNLPAYTYWYDNKGNITRIDPSSDEYDEKTDILFELQENGLYKAVGDSEDHYFANLKSYEKDNEGNLVVGSQIVFFLGDDGEYYAYRTQDKAGNSSYHTRVQDLSTSGAARYDFSNRDELPSAEMKIEGTGEWTTVSFYVHTGDKMKDYRVEVWSGSRDGEVKNGAGYVIFDNFSSANASSNYSDLLTEKIDEIKGLLNEGKDFNDEESGYLGEDDNLPTDKDYGFFKALYYTFTFYDSASYVRYDETADGDDKGNPWGSYKQSEYSEQLVSLFYKEEGGETDPTYSFFLDYSSIDKTIERDIKDTDNSNTSSSSSSSVADSEMNIWLLISSGILAVVLVAVIILVIVRRILEKRKRKTRVSARS